jgi:peptidoglycan-associated lipoprotein
MDQRRWQLRGLAVPVVVVLLVAPGCARRPMVAQVSAPPPLGSAGAGASGAGSQEEAGTAVAANAGNRQGSAAEQAGAGSHNRAGTEVVHAVASEGGAPSGRAGGGAASPAGAGAATSGAAAGQNGSASATAASGGANGARAGASGGGQTVTGARAGGEETGGGAAGATNGGGSAEAGAGGNEGAGASAAGGAGGTQVASATETGAGAPVAAARPAPGEYAEAAALHDIHFDFDRYEIRPGAAKTLDTDAEWLRANPRVLLLIEGHCDERGTNEYNLALGEHRANSTMNYLVSQGVPARRISIISYGEERPLCTEHTESCWARNRRGHFLVKPE